MLLAERDLDKIKAKKVASEIKSGPLPPEIRVKKISTIGKVTISFSNKIEFPPEII
jgi:hypothetical protein